MNKMSETKKTAGINQCKHFVTRKKRFCRMSVKQGNEYCGEHMPKSEDVGTELNSNKKRILCPYDEKHTCYENQLQKHLKKCNAKRILETEIPYIQKHVNYGSTILQIVSSRQLSDASVVHIQRVVEKINKLYDEIVHRVIKERILSHDILNEEISKSEYGQSSKKHLIQTSSLIGHIKNVNLIQPKTCFVEFGAGKGKLSFWIAKAITSTPNTAVLLVERASLRHKLDNKLNKNEINVNRIRADIGDLVLNRVDCIEDCNKIVGVTKHLCGDATDLAINCLINASETKQITGVVMSFCCHHRCHWNCYTGRDFLQKHDFDIHDFNVTCGIVSWATCGSGKSREKKNVKPDHYTIDEDICCDTPEDVRNQRDELIGLSKEEKEKIGKKAKHLLDYGRMDFLKKKGFKCALYYYVPSNVSPENVCLVAHK